MSRVYSNFPFKYTYAAIGVFFFTCFFHSINENICNGREFIWGYIPKYFQQAPYSVILIVSWLSIDLHMTNPRFCIYSSEHFTTFN